MLPPASAPPLLYASGAGQDVEDGAAGRPGAFRVTGVQPPPSCGRYVPSLVARLRRTSRRMVRECCSDAAREPGRSRPAAALAAGTAEGVSFSSKVIWR